MPTGHYKHTPEMYNTRRGRKIAEVSILLCRQCNAKFERRASLIPKKPDSLMFCSRNCKVEFFRTGKITKNCEMCGKEVVRYPSITKRYKYPFCGRVCWAKYKTGRPVSAIQLKNLRKTHLKGEKNPLFGISLTREAKKKISEALASSPNVRRGKMSNFWKGGVTEINKAIRSSYKYKKWRREVFTRDDYTCQLCKVRGVYLHADHIKPFAYFPELRFAIENGRTLCVPCHKATDTYMGRAKKHKRNV